MLWALCVQAHAGNVEASLAFLNDAVTNSSSASLQILGLSPSRAKGPLPEFSLSSLADDPTPAELLTKAPGTSHLPNVEEISAPMLGSQSDPEAGITRQTRLENKIAELGFFDHPGLSERVSRSQEDQPRKSATYRLFPPEEDAVHLATTEAEAMDLAISSANALTAQKRILRAEEDAYRKQWEYHMKLKKIYRAASYLEASKGDSFHKWHQQLKSLVEASSSCVMYLDTLLAGAILDRRPA